MSERFLAWVAGATDWLTVWVVVQTRVSFDFGFPNYGVPYEDHQIRKT